MNWFSIYKEKTQAFVQEKSQFKMFEKWLITVFWTIWLGGLLAGFICLSSSADFSCNCEWISTKILHLHFYAKRLCIKRLSQEFFPLVYFEAFTDERNHLEILFIIQVLWKTFSKLSLKPPTEIKCFQSIVVEK